VKRALDERKKHRSRILYESAKKQGLGDRGNGDIVCLSGLIQNRNRDIIEHPTRKTVLPPESASGRPPFAVSLLASGSAPVVSLLSSSQPAHGKMATSAPEAHFLPLEPSVLNNVGGETEFERYKDELLDRGEEEEEEEEESNRPAPIIVWECQQALVKKQSPPVPPRTKLSYGSIPASPPAPQREQAGLEQEDEQLKPAELPQRPPRPGRPQAARKQWSYLPTMSHTEQEMQLARWHQLSRESDNSPPQDITSSPVITQRRSQYERTRSPIGIRRPTMSSSMPSLP